MHLFLNPMIMNWYHGERKMTRSFMKTITYFKACWLFTVCKVLSRYTRGKTCNSYKPQFPGGEGGILTTYVDVDYGCDLHTKRSTSCIHFKLWNAHRDWSSKATSNMTTSITKVEYQVLSERATSNVWFWRLLTDLYVCEIGNQFMKESSLVDDLTIKYIPTFVQHANTLMKPTSYASEGYFTK